ncbi:MAG: hypothetical protein JSV32_08550 [Dehalococcoidia bacterium]|nr:MAG: hypothetical protein JSV32_08550 [Dehalococcoidia bacterium]
MKKKALCLILTLIISTIMALSATPAMAADTGMDLSISASPAEGDSVDLTVTLVYLGIHRMGSVDVILTTTPPGGPGIHLGPPTSGDTNNDGIVHPGETWTWTLTTIVCEETNFAVTGVGFDLHCDIWLDDSDSVTYDPQCPPPPWPQEPPCPPPPPCYEGLTPGFWKNHLGDWVGYNPTDDFATVFGAGPSITLLDALIEGGGASVALGRHAVAALLNAANPDINYPLTVTEVIAAVYGAWDGGDFEGVKNILEGYNEADHGSCPPDPCPHDPPCCPPTCPPDPEPPCPPLPPCDGEGLTPGYWKNHIEDWAAAGYATGDSFATIFGVTASGTLGDAVKAKGGGENALMRHAVAALLNAAHPDVDYGLTEAEVIAIVQGAYAPGGDFEDAKNTLEWYNELGGDI